MRYKYIFGPVNSWRLGRSLGVDLTPPNKKTCNFDCVYCQLGRTKKHIEKRRVFVKTEDVLNELKRLPKIKIDFITFSGCGEPTLAANLGEVIKKIKRIRKEPVAVITNSALIARKDVQEALNNADIVLFKLDACSETGLKNINNPARGINYGGILSGLTNFRKNYKGKFALQIMFVDRNLQSAADIAEIAHGLKPDEVQINTPTRACGVKPLSKAAVQKIKALFGGLNTVTVYDKRKRTGLKKIVGSMQGRHPS